MSANSIALTTSSIFIREPVQLCLACSSRFSARFNAVLVSSISAWYSDQGQRATHRW